MAMEMRRWAEPTAIAASTANWHSPPEGSPAGQAELSGSSIDPLDTMAALSSPYSLADRLRSVELSVREVRAEISSEVAQLWNAMPSKPREERAPDFELAVEAARGQVLRGTRDLVDTTLKQLEARVLAETDAACSRCCRRHFLEIEEVLGRQTSIASTSVQEVKEEVQTQHLTFASEMRSQLQQLSTAIDEASVRSAQEVQEVEARMRTGLDSMPARQDDAVASGSGQSPAGGEVDLRLKWQSELEQSCRAVLQADLRDMFSPLEEELRQSFVCAADTLPEHVDVKVREQVGEQLEKGCQNLHEELHKTLEAKWTELQTELDTQLVQVRRGHSDAAAAAAPAADASYVDTAIQSALEKWRSECAQLRSDCADDARKSMAEMQSSLQERELEPLVRGMFERMEVRWKVDEQLDKNCQRIQEELSQMLEVRWSELQSALDAKLLQARSDQREEQWRVDCAQLRFESEDTCKTIADMRARIQTLEQDARSHTARLQEELEPLVRGRFENMEVDFRKRWRTELERVSREVLQADLRSMMALLEEGLPQQVEIEVRRRVGEQIEKSCHRMRTELLQTVEVRWSEQQSVSDAKFAEMKSEQRDAASRASDSRLESALQRASEQWQSESVKLRADSENAIKSIADVRASLRTLEQDSRLHSVRLQEELEPLMRGRFESMEADFRRRWRSELEHISREVLQADLRGLLAPLEDEVRQALRHSTEGVPQRVESEVRKRVGEQFDKAVQRLQEDLLQMLETRSSELQSALDVKVAQVKSEQRDIALRAADSRVGSALESASEDWRADCGKVRAQCEDASKAVSDLRMSLQTLERDSRMQSAQLKEELEEFAKGRLEGMEADFRRRWRAELERISREVLQADLRSMLAPLEEETRQSMRHSMEGLPQQVEMEVRKRVSEQLDKSIRRLQEELAQTAETRWSELQSALDVKLVQARSEQRDAAVRAVDSRVEAAVANAAEQLRGECSKVREQCEDSGKSIAEMRKSVQKLEQAEFRQSARLQQELEGLAQERLASIEADIRKSWRDELERISREVLQADMRRLLAPVEDEMRQSFQESAESLPVQVDAEVQKRVDLQLEKSSRTAQERLDEKLATLWSELQATLDSKVSAVRNEQREATAQSTEQTRSDCAKLQSECCNVAKSVAEMRATLQVLEEEAKCRPTSIQEELSKIRADTAEAFQSRCATLDAKLAELSGKQLPAQSPLTPRNGHSDAPASISPSKAELVLRSMSRCTEVMEYVEEVRASFKQQGSSGSRETSEGQAGREGGARSTGAGAGGGACATSTAGDGHFSDKPSSILSLRKELVFEFSRLSRSLSEELENGLQRMEGRVRGQAEELCRQQRDREQAARGKLADAVDASMAELEESLTRQLEAVRTEVLSSASTCTETAAAKQACTKKEVAQVSSSSAGAEGVQTLREELETSLTRSLQDWLSQKLALQSSQASGALRRESLGATADASSPAPSPRQRSTDVRVMIQKESLPQAGEEREGALHRQTSSSVGSPKAASSCGEGRERLRRTTHESLASTEVKTPSPGGGSSSPSGQARPLVSVRTEPWISPRLGGRTEEGLQDESSPSSERRTLSARWLPPAQASAQPGPATKPDVAVGTSASSTAAAAGGGKVVAGSSGGGCAAFGGGRPGEAVWVHRRSRTGSVIIDEVSGSYPSSRHVMSREASQVAATVSSPCSSTDATTATTVVREWIPTLLPGGPSAASAAASATTVGTEQVKQRHTSLFGELSPASPGGRGDWRLPAA